MAPVGISPEEAREIKSSYRGLTRRLPTSGDRIGRPTIEPLDEIEVGASAAKADGILAVAQKSLHF